MLNSSSNVSHSTLIIGLWRFCTGKQKHLKCSWSVCFQTVSESWFCVTTPVTFGVFHCVFLALIVFSLHWSMLWSLHIWLPLEELQHNCCYVTSEFWEWSQFPMVSGQYVWSCSLLAPAKTSKTSCDGDASSMPCCQAKGIVCFLDASSSSWPSLAISQCPASPASTLLRTLQVQGTNCGLLVDGRRAHGGPLADWTSLSLGDYVMGFLYWHFLLISWPICQCICDGLSAIQQYICLSDWSFYVP